MPRFGTSQVILARTEFSLGTLVQQFQSTGIGNSIGVNSVLTFSHSGAHQCCVFEGAIQPRLLDASHYYVALGTGKMAADPFLRFLVDVFCKAGQPNTREAVFLVTWTIQHCIDTAPGGIAEPIRIAIFEPNGRGGFQAKDLPENEIAEHLQAMESAADALRRWRNEMQSGEAADNVPAPPAPPAEAAAEG